MFNIRDKLQLSEECRDWDDADIRPYIPVIDAINFKALIAAARKCRITVEPHAQSLSCSIESNILGSYHVISVLVFSDGLKWVAKVPRYGIAPTFGELTQERMLSEILTLRLIRSRTAVPVPEIYDWDTTRCKIGVPYILMTFLPGTSLDRLWFDRDWATEEMRMHVLGNLARTMSDLHSLRFNEIGSLKFDEKGDFSGVGPVISQTEGDIFHPEFDMIDGNQTIRWPPASAYGPFRTAKSFLLAGVEALDAEKGLSPVARKQRTADIAVLHFAIESIPERLSLDDGDSFIVAHPNLDAPNILVDDDGNITGVIDWDGVQTMPRGYGFSCYPSWITRDWDPIMYGCSEPGYEDTPETLSRYRQAYASAFQDVNLPSCDYIPDETRLSHIYEAIYIAASSYWNLSPIDKLLEHAFRGTSDEPFVVEDFRRNLANELECGKGDELLAQINMAFRKMWYPEWEYGLAL
ncbi:kinase-like domain-containing protein [Tricharina praecox]|uniref:kinase-like domain-containing protein n=1 Tax=Tricharina praecox TaxID=43433 RepID=UPI0022209078|nr:kinase-like domain-containing protein [Tricharina praecox]KAI5858522.1 kinase-like domain-containing protein [Tricharina praecox]